MLCPAVRERERRQDGVQVGDCQSALIEFIPVSNPETSKSSSFLQEFHHSFVCRLPFRAVLIVTLRQRLDADNWLAAACDRDALTTALYLLDQLREVLAKMLERDGSHACILTQIRPTLRAMMRRPVGNSTNASQKERKSVICQSALVEFIPIGDPDPSETNPLFHHIDHSFVCRLPFGASLRVAHRHEFEHSDRLAAAGGRGAFTVGLHLSNELREVSADGLERNSAYAPILGKNSA